MIISNRRSLLDEADELLAEGRLFLAACAARGALEWSLRGIVEGPPLEGRPPTIRDSMLVMKGRGQIDRRMVNRIHKAHGIANRMIHEGQGSPETIAWLVGEVEEIVRAVRA